MKYYLPLSLLACSLAAQDLRPARTPDSLRTVIPPPPSNLAEYVRNQQALVQLGKALFWDMQLGSDGITACASCHFHAGADPRIKNQVSPGGNGRFDLGAGGSNYTLRTQDFPFHQLADPANRDSAVIRSYDDVASSQGVFAAALLRIIPGRSAEEGATTPDPMFRVGNINTRRVAGRNASTVINAVFNFRNFWDGRARELFNGRSPFGPQDRNARVLVAGQGNRWQAVTVAIDNSSLASQAVGPPLSTLEMSYAGRHWPAVGRKMLGLRPLAKQLVSPTDSVLGELVQGAAPGLRMGTYHELVKAAFQPKYWGTAGRADVDQDGNLASVTGKPAVGEYSVSEFNFSLYFGLAVQAYEATLVSDQSPFDRYTTSLGRDTTALTAEQVAGLTVFINQGRCTGCHVGPEFTEAGNTLFQHAALPGGGFAFRGTLAEQGGAPAIFERGFFNIGVRPTGEDLGLGGRDPFGNPLSFTRQAQAGVNRGFRVDPCALRAPPCAPLSATDTVAADGSFKIPTLHNIDLTGPYFHNGSVATLEELVDFYNRKGNFRNPELAGRGLAVLGLTATEKSALVAFMKSLTDPRVAFRRAPFDHPQLCVPNGHPGNQSAIGETGSFGAADTLVEIAAVGRNGAASPLPTFRQVLSGAAYLNTPCAIRPALRER